MNASDDQYRRACFVCGEAPAVRYAIAIELIRDGTPAADLCVEHGALFLMRVGMAIGQLKAEHRKKHG